MNSLDSLVREELNKLFKLSPTTEWDYYYEISKLIKSLRFNADDKDDITKLIERLREQADVLGYWDAEDTVAHRLLQADAHLAVAGALEKALARFERRI